MDVLNQNSWSDPYHLSQRPPDASWPATRFDEPTSTPNHLNNALFQSILVGFRAGLRQNGDPFRIYVERAEAHCFLA
jgi:hypothetical protein